MEAHRKQFGGSPGVLSAIAGSIPPQSRPRRRRPHSSKFRRGAESTHFLVVSSRSGRSGLNEVPTITVQVHEDCNDAVRLIPQFFDEGNAVRPCSRRSRVRSHPSPGIETNGLRSARQIAARCRSSAVRGSRSEPPRLCGATTTPRFSAKSCTSSFTPNQLSPRRTRSLRHDLSRAMP